MKYNPQVQDYIDKKAQPFAKEILVHLRELVHKACPDAEEAIKWGMPCFTYKGKILVNMAAFKAHMAFGFWLQPIMSDPKGILSGGAMGDLGKIIRIEDLPKDRDLTELIHQAMSLIDEGRTLAKKTGEKPQAAVPPELEKALKENSRCKASFEKLSPSQQKEYCAWIAGAKSDATREKRIATTMENLEEGKPKEWKYMDKYK